MENKNSQEAVYDARSLGTPKMLILGLQHLFAMFGATVLVPAITGLNVSTTLLFAGLGTLLFHLVTGRKVPAFLGSSFAFLGAYGLITASGQNIPLTYSSFGVAAAGLVYLVLALLFKVFRARKVMRFFPPIVTGPVIIAIGQTNAATRKNTSAPASSDKLVAQLLRQPRVVRHRHDGVRNRYSELLRQLVGGAGCHSGGGSLQHLGQGHGENRSHSAGCCGLLPVCHGG